MMTFNPTNLAEFFAARSRANMTAEAALKELEARAVTGAPTVSKNSPRAICDSMAQRAGYKLGGISSHHLAEILKGAE